MCRFEERPPSLSLLQGLSKGRAQFKHQRHTPLLPKVLIKGAICSVFLFTEGLTRCLEPSQVTEAIGEVYHLCNEAARRAAVRTHKARSPPHSL